MLWLNHKRYNAAWSWKTPVFGKHSSFLSKNVSKKKKNARANRGEITKCVYLQNLCQKMFQGIDWISLFQNIENKQALTALFSKYLVPKWLLEVIKISIIFTNNKNTFQVAEQSDQILLTCNHEEADTRVVLQAYLTSLQTVLWVQKNNFRRIRSDCVR